MTTKTANTPPHQFSPEDKNAFGGVYLLERMSEGEETFPLVLEGADAHLEPLLSWLYGRDYLEIIDNHHYAVTDKGRDAVDRFSARYGDYLKTMDVYCAVDLQEATFAFEQIFGFDDDALWEDYLNQDHWDDLRVAVVTFKGLNPLETVFMAFLNDERIDEEDEDGSSWQARLTSPGLWAEIEEVCNNAIQVHDLAYEEGGTTISGENVLRQIIQQGAALNLELRKQEDELEDDENAEDTLANGHGEESVVEETVIEHYPVSYYEPYLDPLYVAPIWVGLWLL